MASNSTHINKANYYHLSPQIIEHSKKNKTTTYDVRITGLGQAQTCGGVKPFTRDHCWDVIIVANLLLIYQEPFGCEYMESRVRINISSFCREYSAHTVEINYRIVITWRQPGSLKTCRGFIISSAIERASVSTTLGRSVSGNTSNQRDNTNKQCSDIYFKNKLSVVSCHFAVAQLKNM